MPPGKKRNSSSSSSIFPTFLLPSAPFGNKQRRPNSQADKIEGPNTNYRNNHNHNSTSTSTSTRYLDGHISYIQCARCAADLCLTSQIISKGFTGRHGRAYLVSADSVTTAISMTSSSSPTASLPNTVTHKPVPRQLVTGAHTVSDISCLLCGSILGWKYVAAEEESQRYKVGKFILETQRIVTTSRWDGCANNDLDVDSPGKARDGGEDDESLHDNVEFDSQDEDECEDLFAGVWSPGLATRRRSRKFDRRSTMYGAG
ncbi:hypothetical protein DTO217A2_4899 [Paecilomyces variotii]|nr:hypothetical protein DTO217A2_4899 [Paecilomyces variotii]KAJ9369964.1 hypothetical protein DTO282E5_5304 [Paecilomyces variotii]